MNTRLTRFISALLLLLSLFANCSLQAQSPNPSASARIDTLLSKVPDGAGWQDISAELRSSFEARAGEILSRDRAAWGLKGLAKKEKVLFYNPTKPMLDNVDRVLSVTFATELPNGFSLARDVSSLDLKRMLIRIYLCTASSRAYMLLNHPDFRGWDGLPVKDVELLDHKYIEAIAKYLADTEARLRKIDDKKLTATERLLRDKSYFTTRESKHFVRPPVGRNGSFGLSSVYHLSSALRPFSDDNELLDAYNASMFSDFREVNKGSLESFIYDYDGEFDLAWLTSQGMSTILAGNVMKLGNLYRTRVLGRADRDTPYTFYTAKDRAANWDSFTAKMLTNEDGKESMESYALGYAEVAKRRTEEMRKLAQATVDQLFPPGAAEFSDLQRPQVSARIAAETRPAAIIETIYAALDEATGSKIASEKVKAAIARQAKVGGYHDGEALRSSDEQVILEMWNSIRAFIQREYHGYPVDIAALVPDQPAILTKSEGCFSIGGEVSIGLKNEWFKASLYSTLLHEIKHAIDQRSHAAVEGAAWEGAATSIERQVWPLFLNEVIPDKTDQLVAQLVTAVDNVRFTATTDATLKIFLRPPGNTDPDSFEYAKEVVAGYGYSDPKILSLRSKRANASTQYLEYDYGLVKYLDILAFLQAGVGAAPRVDAYLLQACGIPSPKRNQVFIDRLKTSIKARQ